MSRYELIKNRKSQIGETTTWIVATLIIIGIVIIFIYLSVLISKVKLINFGELNVPSAEKETDLLAQKTSFAHQLAGNKNKEIIDNALKEPPAAEKNIVETILGI